MLYFFFIFNETFALVSFYKNPQDFDSFLSAVVEFTADSDSLFSRQTTSIHHSESFMKSYEAFEQSRQKMNEYVVAIKLLQAELTVENAISNITSNKPDALNGPITPMKKQILVDYIKDIFSTVQREGFASDGETITNLAAVYESLTNEILNTAGLEDTAQWNKKLGQTILR